MPHNKKQLKIIFISLTILIGIISTIGYVGYIKKSRPINVILITLDALRADHLSCYGYIRKTSPNIDQLAKEGALFKQAIAQSPWTVSSLPSIMTSTYPHTHSIMQSNNRLNSTVVPLAKVLKDNGYSTGAISSRHMGDIRGIEIGFDLLDCDWDIKTDEVTKRAIKYLESNQNKKFFLWLHYFDPHGPYRPPQPYKTRYLNDGFVINKINRSAPIEMGIGSGDHSVYGGFRHIAPYVIEDNITDVNYYISQYDGEITFVDEQIGILMKELENLSIDKNTLVIITADHGESLGEHELYFVHGTSYEEVIKVPLIVKYGGSIPKGISINYQVQSIDIMPTILDILNIKKPKGIEGINLFSPLRWQKLDFYRKAFSEYKGSNRYVALIRTNDWKLIYSILDISDFVEAPLKELLEKNNCCIVESMGYYAKMFQGKGIGQHPDTPLNSFNNNASFQKEIDLIKDKQNIPFFAWFHKGRFSDKSLLLQDNIYFTDIGYYVMRYKRKVDYSAIQMYGFISELKKMALNKKTFILFTSEKKNSNKFREWDDKVNEISEDEPWELIYVGTPLMPPEYKLYNLKSDPYEVINLIEEKKSIFKFLKQKLDDFIDHSQISKIEIHHLEEELKEKFKSFGYLQ